MRPKDPLIEMEKKAKRIKKLQFIANTILANGCYHTKEMESQIMTAEKLGHIDEKEKEIICLAWELRNKEARELMEELGGYIENEKKEKRKEKNV